MEATKFQNATVYNRTQHNEQNPFNLFTNKIFTDSRLTFIELGIITKILSNSDNYVFNSDYFQKQGGISKYTYNIAMNNLKKYGYVSKTPKKSGGWVWIINEIPVSVATPAQPTAQVEQLPVKEKIIEPAQPEEELGTLTAEQEEQINNKIQTLINEMEQEKEAPEMEVQPTDENAGLYERIELYIDSKNDDKYDSYDDTFNNVTKDFSYEELTVLNDNYEAFKERKKLNYKSYPKIKFEIMGMSPAEEKEVKKDYRITF